jgi:2-polyprenyl-6-methoxyphenol hydroxylase-like FAD-dependent oxidoreductase
MRAARCEAAVNQKILVTGASIAGPALAWWLERFGFVPTLVEKAPSPRPGGHAIDIRGAALDVVRAMDLLDEIASKRTRMTGVSKLNASGAEIWRSEDMTISGGSFGKEAIEILRDDLSQILVEALGAGIERIYGDSVAAVSEDESGVTVEFDNAAARRFDLVIGADGLGSAMRKMVFGPDDSFLRPFDIVLAPFSAPNILGLKDWQLTYDGGRKNSCIIYTAPDNEALRVCFGFPAKIADLPGDRAAQIALVRETCAHMRWEVPRLLDAMEAGRDFYLGPIAQVKMEHWTHGRIALVGDAAYCPSPFTGQGTSLAIVGAYVLAWELARSPRDHAAAFAGYERRMRPFVEINQAIADLCRDPRFREDPRYYLDVVEPAMADAEGAIELPAF